MNSQEIRKSFCAHVVLYAKGWYGDKEDHLNDLKALLSEYSEIDKEHISDDDIREFVVETFVAVANPRTMPEALMEAFGWKWRGGFSGMNRDAISVMLGQISVSEGEWAHKDLIFQKFARKPS